MTEVFRNLAEGVLAGPYTAAGTTLTLVSAAGFPPSGVFRVRLGNPDKTIFRVDSVAGAVFTGEAEEFDGDAAAGASVSAVISRGTLERFLQLGATGDFALRLVSDALLALQAATAPNREWRFRREQIANMYGALGVDMLSLAPDVDDDLKLYFAAVAGGQRVAIWDPAVALALHPHTGSYPAFAVHGDLTIGDLVTFSPAGNAWIVGMRIAANLVPATDITHLMCAQKAAGDGDTDVGATIDLYPTDNAGGATEDGIIELLAFGRGSGGLANAILLSNRSAAGVVTRRWQMGGPGNVGDLVPFLSNAYRLGTLAKAPKSVAASAGTGAATGHASIVLAQDTAAGTGCPADTNENDLKTYTLPANSLATNGDMVRVTMSFRCAANATTKRIQIKFGGTTLLDSSAIALNNQILNVQLYITRTGAAAQYCQGAVIGAAVHNNWSTALVGDCNFPSDPGKDLTAAQIIKATVTLGAGAALNDVIQDMLIVEYLRKA